MLLIFSGFNKRYKFINNILLNKYDDSSVIIQKDFKGDYKGKYNNNLRYDENTIKIFENHMYNRDITEKYFYQNDKFNFNQQTKYFYTNSKELNSKKIIDFILDVKPSLVFTFGVGILKPAVLNALDGVKHFGITPYYRGSNTLLWPLYNQNPAFVGITLHQIDSKVDNGPIYHQQKTIFSHKDSIHEIFCKTILQAAEPTTKIIDLLMNGNEIEPIYPNNEGKLFFGKEFNPNHLRIIYQLIEEGMLKNYLDNESLFIQPKLKSIL